MYEKWLDYKLSLDEFKSLLLDLDRQINERDRKYFDCDAVKWIVDYLKENNTMPSPDILQDNADYNRHYTDGDYLHVFNDGSAISVYYRLRNYIHISPKAENVEGYMLFGVDFKNEPFVFVLKEIFSGYEERKPQEDKMKELKATIRKLDKLEMKKTNQGKKIKRELRAKMDSISLEIDKYMTSSYAEYLENLK